MASLDPRDRSGHDGSDCYLVLFKKILLQDRQGNFKRNKCSKIDHLISLKLNPLESAITQIHTSLNSLVVYLKSRDGLMDVTLFKAFSPIQLTEAGKYTLELMGGKKFVEENLEELFKSLESYEVDTPPDNPNLAPL
ncbi:MAG: hypothetical protein KGM98_00300 [Bacteroidota bacterium]|nr:hypothetical protein [Bacteroidota bacterium]